MKTLSNRLKEFIDYKKLSVRKFEKEVGATDGTFQKIIKNNTSTSEENIQKIFRKYPELNHGWLLSEVGPMLKISEPKEEQSKQIDSLLKEIEYLKTIVENQQQLIKVLQKGKK